MKAAILTYHSQNVAGSETGNNDHVALAADLDTLHAAGARFVSLRMLVYGLFSGGILPTSQPLVCLTFDDGCDFDFRSFEFPGFGVQTGFLQIMEDFVHRHGEVAQFSLHATSFVIADPQARQIIDQTSLFGKGHMSDDWWREANKHPMMAIANHGWDHNHPDLEERHYARGGFEVVDTQEYCYQQVIVAARLIHKIAGRYPTFFAYPFGESSQYMRDVWFPNHFEQHRSLVALGTDPGLVSSGSNRWNLPRFVCGRDWSTPTELLNILSL